MDGSEGPVFERSEGRGSPRVAGAARAVPLERPRRILLVDDDGTLRSLATLALQRAGFVVEQCSDGVEALARLSDAVLGPADACYDLLVSDVHMPGVSGLTVLESVVTSAANVPTIIVTADGDPAVRQQALRLGAAAVLRKPFDLGELVSLSCRIARQPELQEA